MVNSKKIVTFTQTTNSCVMASYGITANYFTGIEVRNFFNDYCKHYDIQKFNLTKYFGQVKITKENMSELAYDSHFHGACKNSRISGLEFIKNLYDLSGHKSFLESRKIFALSYYSDKELHRQFNNILFNLKHNNSLFIAAFNEGRHIAVFGYDNNEGWFTVETRPSKDVGIQFISSIQDYCNVGDGMIASEQQ